MKKGILLSLLLLGSMAVDAARKHKERRRKRQPLAKVQPVESKKSFVCDALLKPLGVGLAISFFLDRGLTYLNQSSRFPKSFSNNPVISLGSDNLTFLGINYPNGTKIFDGSDFEIFRARNGFLFTHENVIDFALDIGVDELSDLVIMYSCDGGYSTISELPSVLTNCRKLFAETAKDKLAAIQTIVETTLKAQEEEKEEEVSSVSYHTTQGGKLTYERVNYCVVEDDEIVCHKAKKVNKNK